MANNGLISDLRISQELLEQLDKVYRIADEEAKKAGLPPIVKNDLYRMLLRIGAEQWLNKKSKKE